jgi:hypothetical protein
VADLYAAGGALVRLGPALASGGEGAIHPLADRPGLCAKVYHPAARTPERRRKLEAMLARVPRDPTEAQGHRSLAWPQQLLLEAPGGRVAGFVMPLLPAGARTALEYMQPEDRLRRHPGFHYRYLLTAARNAASAFAAVHQAGCCVGDVNESNTLITPSALVTLIDCDSFQVADMPCPVGKAEYTAPELAGRPLGSTPRTPQSDAFGLAVLIFQLLMQGYHPFAGRWPGGAEPPPLAVRIREGLYVYGGLAGVGGAPPARPAPRAPPPRGGGGGARGGRGGGGGGAPPPPPPPPPTVLPRQVRLGFERAFLAGAVAPDRRPSAGEWTEILDRAQGELTVCRARPGEHHHPRRLRSCPWCALARQGYDYFPAAVGAQVALPPPAAPVRAPEPGLAKLVFDPVEVTMSGVVRGGAPRTSPLTVRNIGRGWYRGPVLVGPAPAVVAVAPAELALSPFHGENEARLTIRVDAGAVDWGRRYVRVVRAGGATARVVVTAADSAAAVAAARRYARIGVWAGAGVAGALALLAGWRLAGPAAEALRQLGRVVLTPAAAGLWVAGVAAWLGASRAWRVRGNWRSLWADRRWSPRAGLAAAGLAVWPPASLWLGARYFARPSTGRLDLDLAVLLVPPAWLAARPPAGHPARRERAHRRRRRRLHRPRRHGGRRRGAGRGWAAAGPPRPEGLPASPPERLTPGGGAHAASGQGV